MMKKTILLTLAVVACTVLAQTTQPASPAETELRATQAFNRGEYAIALPLLKKTADNLKDQPDRLGSINEMIRVAEKGLAAAKLQAPPATPAASATDSAHRTPHAAPEKGKVQEMSIKDLGNFDYDNDKGGNIPDDVKKLSGSTVRLNGFMIPMDQAERISKFALVPSLFGCCFGQPPQIQHTIVVTCPTGKAVSYFPDELVIEGVLTVEEKKEDDIITSIFQLQTTSVKPAAK